MNDSCYKIKDSCCGLCGKEMKSGDAEDMGIIVTCKSCSYVYYKIASVCPKCFTENL